MSDSEDTSGSGHLSSSTSSQQDLLSAFVTHYQHFQRVVPKAVTGNTDSTVLARLGDDVDTFMQLVIEVHIYLHGF